MTKTVCLVSHPCVRKRNLGQKQRVEGEAGRVAAMRPVESLQGMQADTDSKGSRSTSNANKVWGPAEGTAGHPAYKPV